MGVSFKGKKDRSYPPKGIINRLSTFILENHDYFETFCSICIDAKREETRQKQVDIIIEQDRIARKINPTKIADFKKLLDEYFSSKVDQISGKVVENIVKNISPIKIPRDKSINSVYEAKIIDNGTEISDKDFDIVNFINSDINIAELIECKLDIYTFIYRSAIRCQPPYNYDGIEKTHFMCEAYKIVKYDFNTYVIFATLRNNLDNIRMELKNLGFSEFQVVGGLDLLKIIA